MEILYIKTLCVFTIKTNTTISILIIISYFNFFFQITLDCHDNVGLCHSKQKIHINFVEETKIKLFKNAFNIEKCNI